MLLYIQRQVFFLLDVAGLFFKILFLYIFSSFFFLLFFDFSFYSFTITFLNDIEAFLLKNRKITNQIMSDQTT